MRHRSSTAEYTHRPFCDRDVGPRYLEPRASQQHALAAAAAAPHLQVKPRAAQLLLRRHALHWRARQQICVGQHGELRVHQFNILAKQWCVRPGHRRPAMLAQQRAHSRACQGALVTATRTKRSGDCLGAITSAARGLPAAARKRGAVRESTAAVKGVQGAQKRAGSAGAPALL